MTSKPKWIVMSKISCAMNYICPIITSTPLLTVPTDDPIHACWIVGCIIFTVHSNTPVGHQLRLLDIVVFVPRYHTLVRPDAIGENAAADVQN